MPKFTLLLLVMVFAAGLFVDCGDDDDDRGGDDDDSAGDDDAGDDEDDDESDDDVDNDAADDDVSDDDTSGGETWTDTTSGWMWTVEPGPETMNWADAKSYCAGLGYGGYDDWGLPTISQLRSLIRGCAATAPGGACGVTDDCLGHGDCWSEVCWSCDEGTGPAEGHFWPSEMHGPAGWYWSASAVSDYPGWAWAIPFSGGDIDTYDVTLNVYVRCVR